MAGVLASKFSVAKDFVGFLRLNSIQDIEPGKEYSVK